MKKDKLIISGFGRPREEIKRFPIGSYAVKVEKTYFINNRWIEHRKRPLYHVVEITGFIDMDGVFGHSGLHTSKIGTHYKKEKAIKMAEKLNEERQKNPLKPQKLINTSKKIEPLRTPEGENFRKEASKLDNWIYHRRITEYLNGEKPKK